MPELLVGHYLRIDGVGEGGHRRSVEPRAQPRVDLLHRAAAVELPVLRQIGGANGVVEVVCERRRRLAVAASLFAVTLEALELLERFAPVGKGLGRRRRGIAQDRKST